MQNLVGPLVALSWQVLLTVSNRSSVMVSNYSFCDTVFVVMIRNNSVLC